MGYDYISIYATCSNPISTHVPRVGYDLTPLEWFWVNGISTHVPRVGYDLEAIRGRYSGLNFNSRTPCGVRHNPFLMRLILPDFNSRTPCGVRRKTDCLNFFVYPFQLTYPVWGTTGFCDTLLPCNVFQLTYPVWGTTCIKS